jgi:protein subunit release factor B
MTRELLFSVTVGDLEIQTFRAGGPGGQNQNKRDTGVRLIHAASGARGEAREERSQQQNKHTALVKLSKTPQFKFWVAQKINQIDGIQTAEQWVESEMKKLDHFKLEVKDENGNWVVDPDGLKGQE